MIDDDRADELASAYLDGEATPAERAAVDGDPALLARVEQFRAVRSALGEPLEAADPAQRGAMIAAALSATVAVDDLAAYRRRRARLLGPIAAAAAVVALVIGAAAIILSLAQSGGSDSASTALTTTTAGARNAERAASGAAVPATAAASATAAPPAAFATGAPSLGSFADEGALRAALRAAPAAPVAASTSTAGTGTAKDSAAPPACALGDGGAVYNAVLAGRPVIVVVRGTIATVVDAATCTASTLDLAGG